jgi:ribosomal protein S18 acetylase RimI-like enzyme
VNGAATSEPRGEGPANAAPIATATTPADIAHVRRLFEAYQRELGVDLCFQGFARELASLPGEYSPPRGRLLLAGASNSPVGCAALRPLAVADRPDGTVAEVKRLYLAPLARGSGLGRALVERLIAEARAIGYRELRLDTLAQMEVARALYRSLGFREIAPYYWNPLPGVRYMALALPPAN